MGEASGCKSASFPEAISAIGPWAMSPLSLSCYDGKGRHLSVSVCPLYLQSYISMLWQKCYLCTIDLYQVHWIPKVHNRCKGLEFGFCKNYVNNRLVCQSQQFTSHWSCLCATYRFIPQTCGHCSSQQNQCPRNVFPSSIIYGGRKMEVSPSAFQLITRSIVPLQAFLIIIPKLSLTTFCHAHPGMPQICHNFTIRGVGDQELPDLTSSSCCQLQ